MSRLRLSVATKIFLCFAVVLVTFASVSITSIVSLHRLGSDLGVVGESYLPLTKAMAQLESFHKNKERDTDRILQEKDRAAERVLIGYTRLYFPKIMRERVSAARGVVQAARAGAHGADLAFLTDMDDKLASLYDRYGDYNAAAGELHDALGKRDADDELVAQKGQALKKVEAQIGHDVQLLSAAVEYQVARRVEQVHRAEVLAAWAIIALTLAAIAFGLLVTGLAQRLLNPIRVLTEGVKGISRGEFGREIPLSALSSNDELGTLAREFNAMAASLRERERQLLEQGDRLLKSERLAAIGKISAQITHEIRNPLSSIGLNAELLSEEISAASFKSAAQQEEALALLQAIMREIDRLTEVSEQYLAFARKPRALSRRVQLNDLCQDLAEFLEPELARARTKVQLDLEEDLPPVSGDEGQLRQALLNLVRNAKEAMAQTGGQLTLRTRLALANGTGDDEVLVEVEDQGPGISREAEAHLFDPFYSTKSGGTGLGLPLSQRIAQEHGGSLRCERRGDRGATFILTLKPAAAAAQENEHARPDEQRLS
jgi:signal transduction histidine kinase